MSSGSDGIAAAQSLYRIGPTSFQAFRRLLHSEYTHVRLVTVYGLGGAPDSWAFPIVVEAAQDRDEAVAGQAIDIAQRCFNRTFWSGGSRNVRAASASLLRWWQQEGGMTQVEGAGNPEGPR